MAKDAKVKITAVTDVAKAIGKTTKSLRKLGKVTKGVMRGIQGVGRGVATMFRRLRVVGIAGVAAFGAIGVAIKKSFDFEAARVQFKVLLGSMDAAKKRFNDLKEFSAKTPFQLTELIEASKTVENFSGGLLDNARTLKVTGDAAAALGKDMEEVTFWYSRFFALTRGKQATGEERRRMLELGLVTAEGVTQLKNMAAAGASLKAQMAVLDAQFLKFEGGMKELATTGHGLFSTLKDNWTISLATFGDALSDMAKTDITNLINTLKRLRTDGSITEWAGKAATALRTVRALFAGIFGDKDARKESFGAIGDVLLGALQAGGSFIVKALLSAAPRIGGLIGASMKGGLGIGMDALNDAKNAKLYGGNIATARRAREKAEGLIAGQEANQDRKTGIARMRQGLQRMRKMAPEPLAEKPKPGIDPDGMEAIDIRFAKWLSRKDAANKAREAAKPWKPIDALKPALTSHISQHPALRGGKQKTLHKRRIQGARGLTRLEGRGGGGGLEGAAVRLEGRGMGLLARAADVAGLKVTRKGMLGEKNNPMFVHIAEGIK